MSTDRALNRPRCGLWPCLGSKPAIGVTCPSVWQGSAPLFATAGSTLNTCVKTVKAHMKTAGMLALTVGASELRPDSCVLLFSGCCFTRNLMLSPER